MLPQSYLFPVIPSMFFLNINCVNSCIHITSMKYENKLNGSNCKVCPHLHHCIQTHIFPRFPTLLTPICLTCFQYHGSCSCFHSTSTNPCLRHVMLRGKHSLTDRKLISWHCMNWWNYSAQKITVKYKAERNTLVTSAKGCTKLSQETVIGPH
jgi:hypothetical protein